MVEWTQRQRRRGGTIGALDEAKLKWGLAGGAKSGVRRVMEKLFKVSQVAQELVSASGSYAQAIVDRVRAMEQEAEAYGEDKALIVYCDTAGGPLKVERLQFSDGALIVVNGIDADGRPTSFISTVFALQLTCKIVEVPAGAELSNRPIAFDLPDMHRQAKAVGFGN